MHTHIHMYINARKHQQGSATSHGPEQRESSLWYDASVSSSLSPAPLPNGCPRVCYHHGKNEKKCSILIPTKRVMNTKLNLLVVLPKYRGEGPAIS